MPLNYDKWNALEVLVDQLRGCMDPEAFCITSSLMIQTLRVTQMSIMRLWCGKWQIIGMHIYVGKIQHRLFYQKSPLERERDHRKARA